MRIEKAAAAEQLRLSQELEVKEKAARDAVLQAEQIKAEKERLEKEAVE